MAIYVDSCEAQETIVITTRSSVYELVFQRAERGNVLVRGGRYFTEFSPVVFLGSIADDGSFKRDTIDVGARLKFVFGEQFVITSPVESLSRDSMSAISPGVCRGTVKPEPHPDGGLGEAFALHPDPAEGQATDCVGTHR